MYRESFGTISKSIIEMNLMYLKEVVENTKWYKKVILPLNQLIIAMNL